MRLELDHLAVAGATLAAATTHLEHALGLSTQQGGEHGVFHTHNRLLGASEGLYLEAIAIDPDAPRPDRARWFDLDRFKGSARLCNWICRCDDLDAVLARMPDGFGAPVTLQRGDLRWRMAVPRSGILPFDNCAPALMQWDGAVHPSQRLAQTECQLVSLTVRHPQARDLSQLLAVMLEDDRVVFTQGEPALLAEFHTRDGVRRLA